MNAKELIEQNWGGPFREYGFSLTKDLGYSYRYESETCILHFDLSEPGYPSILFIDPKDEAQTKHAWDKVLEFACPDLTYTYPKREGPGDKYSMDSLAHHLKFQGEMTAAHLGHVLSGDFSFARAARLDEIAFQRDMQKLFTLPKGHPAKEAFRDGGTEWRGML